MILGNIGLLFQYVWFILFLAATPPSAKKIKLVELDGAAADDRGGATTTSDGSGDDVPVDVSFEQVDANRNDEPSVGRAQVPADDEKAPTEADGARGETAANDSDTEADEGELVEVIDEHGLGLASCRNGTPRSLLIGQSPSKSGFSISFQRIRSTKPEKNILRYEN
jgi:hypothetical protein